jgi:hypothetical protein
LDEIKGKTVRKTPEEFWLIPGNRDTIREKFWVNLLEEGVMLN